MNGQPCFFKKKQFDWHFVRTINLVEKWLNTGKNGIRRKCLFMVHLSEHK